MPAPTANGDQFIRVVENTFDEETGLASSQKSGLILVKPEKAQEIFQKLSTGDYNIQWGARQRGTTLYDVQVLTHANAEVE